MRASFRTDRIAILLLWSSLIATGGCATGLYAHLDTVYKGKIIFPPPPERPRIEFLMSLYEITPKGSSLADILAGPAGTEPAYLPILPRPFGLYVRDDVLYIVDPSIPRLTKVNLDSGKAFHFGLQYEPAHITPVDIAVGPDGKAYVTDSSVGRVFIYGPDGEFEGFLAEEGLLKRPTGIDIDMNKFLIYVADTIEHKIKVFDQKGNLVKVIGKRGEAPGEFNYPVHLCYRAGKLYVVDAMNFRVQIFDSQGNLLRVFGRAGNTYADLERPKGIGVDSFGNIYIADAMQDMVKIYDPQGRLLLFFGQKGKKLGEFSMPEDIFVDDRNRIFVADMANMRVQVFRLLEGGGQR